MVELERRGAAEDGNASLVALSLDVAHERNTRLDRLFGLDRIVQFIEDVENAKIERLRQAALYADRGETGVTVPADVIDREEALFCVASLANSWPRCCRSYPNCSSNYWTP